jgi:putative endopeptidase
MLSGSTGSRPDEETAYAIVCSTLTTPMNRAFLAKYDSTKMKEEVTRICEESIAYYRELLSTEEWLSDETRKKAVEKLDAIRINAVYPEKWRDYSGLSLKGLGFYDSVNAIRKFEKAYNASLLNTKVDHDLWNFDILETNAYYEPLENSINIIRGILGGVFYREDMTTEELYAGIGSVIGHEISHAFDTSGAQFDATGAMNDWWTKEDYAAFLGRAQKLIDYYNSMTAFGGYKVQGANIQGEAIADMAGMKCMLGLLSQKENVDYRRFFESYAKIWGRINTRETEYYQLMQDSHPLAYLRTNVTVQQFDEFLETFDIVEGDGMYLSPEDRVLVW